jgi:hypothetical protein
VSAVLHAARAAATVVLVVLSAAGVRFGPPLRGAAGEPKCAWHPRLQRVPGPDAGHRLDWACQPVIAPREPPAPPLPAGQPGPAPAPEGTAEPGRADYLGVRSREFEFLLSRPSVESGEVTIQLQNQGAEPHDLNVQREGGAGEPVLSLPAVEPSRRQVAHFELPPGTYRLWCGLPGHARKGMHATLLVR